MARGRFDKGRSRGRFALSAEVITASSVVARGNRTPGNARTQGGANGAGNRSQGSLPRPSPAANLAGNIGRDDHSGVRERGLHGLPTATMLYVPGDRCGRHISQENMTCPYCQTPLERGEESHSRCLVQSEAPATESNDSFVVRILQTRRAPRVIEYRCANGHRVEQTAP